MPALMLMCEAWRPRLVRRSAYEFLQGLLVQLRGAQWGATSPEMGHFDKDSAPSLHIMMRWHLERWCDNGNSSLRAMSASPLNSQRPGTMNGVAITVVPGPSSQISAITEKVFVKLELLLFLACNLRGNQTHAQNNHCKISKYMSEAIFIKVRN